MISMLTSKIKEKSSDNSGQDLLLPESDIQPTPRCSVGLGL